MGTPSPRRGHTILRQSSFHSDVLFRKRIHEIKPEYVYDERLQIQWMLGQTKRKETPTIERILFLHMEREALASIWLICIWYRLILFDGREFCGWCSVEEAEGIKKRRPSQVQYLSRLAKPTPQEKQRAARPNQAHLKNLKQFDKTKEDLPVHGPMNKRPEVLH